MIIDNIKKIRETKKISQQRIANFLNISQGTYRDIESSKIRLSLDNFLLICEYLEISPMQLLKQNADEQYLILSEKDINDLKRILNKINNQTNLINDNHGIINITGGENK
ncbi:MAG: helix-turn-helix transcriptional regulator [Candidatus Onthovivens sp.]|nr:helix-turn-helix transcriptional regulator [Candidatus Onthovivens sp.]